jgi:hypothetical protein
MGHVSAISDTVSIRDDSFVVQSKVKLEKERSWAGSSLRSLSRWTV